MIRFMQGSNYPAVTSDIVGNTLIPYPNNPKEKEKIITILLNIDDLIQKQKQVIIQTQKLLKAQSYSLLTKGIGYTDSELVEIKYGQRWMIEKFPKNWKPTSLSKLCKIRKNEDLSSNTYVGLENIQDDGNNNLISKEDSSLFSSTKIFKEGDVLYGKLRPYLNKIWLATEEGYCSTDILPLVVKEKIDNVFLLNVLRSKLFLNYAISTSSGTKMPRIEWSDIQKFVIALPPTIEEQEKIASILSNLDSLIKQEKQYKEKLEKIKRGLMQQLLTGQTRVKV